MNVALYHLYERFADMDSLFLPARFRAWHCYCRLTGHHKYAKEDEAMLGVTKAAPNRACREVVDQASAYLDEQLDKGVEHAHDLHPMG
jgi:hypothetical protein